MSKVDEYFFDRFCLVSNGGNLLLRQGEDIIGKQNGTYLRVLLPLVQFSKTVVTNEQLYRSVWAEQFFRWKAEQKRSTRDNLSTKLRTAIYNLRKTLGDRAEEGGNHQFIAQEKNGGGYKFVAEVEHVSHHIHDPASHTNDLQDVIDAINDVESAVPESDYQPLMIRQLITQMCRGFIAEFRHQYGLSPDFVDYLRSHLASAQSIGVVDARGPNEWSLPLHDNYINCLSEHYARHNMVGQTWQPVFGEVLRTAMQAALDHGETLPRRIEDRPAWTLPMPPLPDAQHPIRFEYSRILMWTREDLLSAMGRRVIDYHLAFHIPLFFIETPDKDEIESFMYVLKHDGEMIPCVFREENCAPKFITLSHATHDDLLQRYQGYLRDPRLRFAHDEYFRLKHQTPPPDDVDDFESAAD